MGHSFRDTSEGCLDAKERTIGNRHLLLVRTSWWLETKTDESREGAYEGTLL